jgi:serine/threonine protein kinase
MDTVDFFMRKFGLSAANAQRIAVRVQQNGLLGAAFDRTTGVVYFYHQELGRGAFGTVYLASQRSTRRERATLAVKQIAIDAAERPVAGAAQSYHNANVEREYLIAELLRSRLAELGNSDGCERHFVCAATYFYAPAFDTGYLVSPFAGLRNLSAHIALAIRPLMARFRRRFAQLNYRSIKAMLALAEQEAATSGSGSSRKRGPSDAQQMTLDLLLVRQRILLIAHKLAVSVQLLHYARTFHRDLKPDNIIVSVSADDATEQLVRLVDFGVACSVSVGDRSFADELGVPLDAKQIDLIDCPESTRASIFFMDPLSLFSTNKSMRANGALRITGTQSARDMDAVDDDDDDELSFDEDNWEQLSASKRQQYTRIYYGRFDVYSFAKIVQVLCDDQLALAETLGQGEAFPLVRKTDFMSATLFDLIGVMTGETADTTQAYLLNDSYYPPDIDARIANFDRRPLMGTVLDKLRLIMTRTAEQLRVRRERYNAAADDDDDDDTDRSKRARK